MELPDIIGFRLEDATEVLRQAGFIINEIIETNSPKQFQNNFYCELRVICVECVKEKEVNVLVCKMQSSPLTDKVL